MNIGMYQSAASLSALERWQDSVAQNITSSQTTGFRKHTLNFTSEIAGRIQNEPGAKVTSDDGMGAVFPKVESGLSFTNGETQVTKRDLDVAIQGPGFFEVQNADGTKGYTRDGEFRMKPDRSLTTADGAAVLGDNGSPIVTVANGGQIVINHDGTISQGGAPLGKLSVQQFSDPSKLVPAANGRFSAPSGITPTAVADPNLAQGSLEGSNVVALREMVDLVTISRAYEANQKIITTVDQQMEKTLDALG